METGFRALSLGANSIIEFKPLNHTLRFTDVLFSVLQSLGAFPETVLIL